MTHQRIEDGLREATETRHVLIGQGVLSSVAELFERGFGMQPAVIVADETTFRVAGEAVRDQLQAAGHTLFDPYVFPARPTLYADYQNITSLALSLREHSAIPVAVGSGTVNDIVKRAAFECDRQYMSVATAASMDGYTAFGAAITKDGFKQTMECPAPRTVLADLDVLSDAPSKMTSAGYADLLAKVSAGADWIIADALEIEPIDPTAWSLVQTPLREATEHPHALHVGDIAAMNGLVEGLIMSGIAMQVTSSSRPASGAEHQFSHLWEMEGLGQGPSDGGPPLSHGFKVGLGTLSVAALYQFLLTLDIAAVDVEGLTRSWPTWPEVELCVRAAHPNPELVEAVVEQSRAKYVTADKLAQRLGLLQRRWPELREQLRAQLMPAARLEALLIAAQCPTTPFEIGLSSHHLKTTYRRAQMIRRRYTVLDLANETGLLDSSVSEMFTDGGFWCRESPDG